MSTVRAELRQLLPLAGPIILSQLGQIGMNTVDTVIVGGLGAQALAAVGLGGAIYMVLFVLCSGVVFSLGPLVSQAHGAGDRDRAQGLFHQGLWLALIASVPVIVGALAGRPIALALGQDATVAALCGAYLRALAWGIAPAFAFLAFRQYSEAIGHVRSPMVITLAGLVLNAVACSTLVYGVPGWLPACGVTGSGWATSLVRWTMLLMAGGSLVTLRDTGGQRPAWRPEKAVMATMVRIGLPIGIQTALEVGLFAMAAVMMGWISPLALAAHQVTINIASTTFMVAMGMSQAGAIRVGHLIGGGRRHHLRHAVAATYVVALGFMSLCALLFISVPAALVRLHTPDGDVIALGSRLLFIAALFQLFDGAQVAGSAILRGAADTRAPMVIGAVGYWAIGLPVGYVLAFRSGAGPLGVWAGLCVGLAAVAVLLGWRVKTVLGGPTTRTAQPLPSSAQG